MTVLSLLHICAFIISAGSILFFRLNCSPLLYPSAAQTSVASIDMSVVVSLFIELRLIIIAK